MKRVQSILMAVIMVLASIGVANGDWYPGDPYKMHFPQLPDPFGWDIEISSVDLQHEIADDWRCTETGPVTDIHFWTSWEQDQIGTIQFIEIRIYDDDRVTNPTMSQPGNLLWSRIFDQSQFIVVSPYGTGDQGFADPQLPIWSGWYYQDHQQFQQINIAPIQDPFMYFYLTSQRKFTIKIVIRRG